MKIGAIACLTVVILLMAAPAYAYVDPGTGGMLIQLVTGGIAGLLVLTRLFWSRIRDVFRRQPASPHTARPPDATPAGHDQV